MLTEADILSALRDCYDPELPLNIVDLGLIQRLQVEPDFDAPGTGIPGVPSRYHAHITLFAPGSDEAANAQLAAQVENRLLGVQAISRVTITLLPALFSIL